VICRCDSPCTVCGDCVYSAACEGRPESHSGPGRKELSGPGGALWTWGDPAAADRVTGRLCMGLIYLVWALAALVMVTVTALSSLVVADPLFATGGVLHTCSDGSPAGSDGAAGEQAPVVCEGHVPTGAPLVGKVEPEMSMVPHAVRVICPCAAAGRDDAEPVGRTSPKPLVQITLPE